MLKHRIFFERRKLTVKDFHITYQIPITIVNYAIKSGLLYIRDKHIIEDANFTHFLAHSELFTAQNVRSDVQEFWRRCVPIHKDNNCKIYDHRRKTGRNYFTVFTRDGLIETFTSKVIAKKWAKARFAKPVRKHKIYHLALTLEQMDWIITSGKCATRQDIIDKVSYYYNRQLEKNKLEDEVENAPK
jgi:Fe-S-cluster containining protein